MTERVKAVTMKGEPLTLLGSELKIGDDAPFFTALNGDLSEVTLNELPGKIKVIASVPSLDTPVCDLEAKRFNKEAAALSDDVSVTIVSMDLPFAQSRFCASSGIDNITTLSDHREASLGHNYGVLIKELRLLARAVFVIRPDGKIAYTEYVDEVTEQPDFDKVISVIKDLL